MKKLLHKEARYQDAHYDGKRCGSCAMFTASPASCTLVEDPVKATGVCKHWRQDRRRGGDT